MISNCTELSSSERIEYVPEGKFDVLYPILADSFTFLTIETRRESFLLTTLCNSVVVALGLELNLIGWPEYTTLLRDSLLPT